MIAHHKFKVKKVYRAMYEILRDHQQKFFEKEDIYAHDPALFAHDLGKILIGYLTEIGLHHQQVLHDLKLVAEGWCRIADADKSRLAGAAAKLRIGAAIDRATQYMAIRGDLSFGDYGGDEAKIMGCVADLIIYADEVGWESWIITQAASDLVEEEMLKATRYEAALKTLSASSKPN